MALTKEQAKSLLTKAKERNPKLTRDQAKAILAEANKRTATVSKPEDTRTGFQKVADFGGVTTTTGNVGVLGFLGQGDVTKSAGASASASFQTANTLTQLAKK
jgi:hypothetical protein